MSWEWKFPEAHKANIRPKIGAGMGIAHWHAAGVQSGKQRAEVGPDARLSAAGRLTVGLGESVRLE